jgi:hypothetical protein
MGGADNRIAMWPIQVQSEWHPPYISPQLHLEVEMVDLVD